MFLVVRSDFSLGLKIESNLGLYLEKDYRWLGLKVGVSGCGVATVFFFKI